MLFELALPEDEGEIRRLLRENPLGGAYPISLEREPDGWGGPHLTGERRCFVLARETMGGPAVGLCERVVRPAFINGEERLLPYLGALRVAERNRRRIAILKGGFAALRQAERTDECRFAITSITADNHQARRVLTAGLSGLPTYRPLGEYSTLVLRPRQGGCTAVAEAQDKQIDELACFLNRRLRLRQFAPCWSADDLRRLEGVTFLIALANGAIVGCLSLWDQRRFRQTVVRGYPPQLRRLRPAINVAGRLLGLPYLPAVGATLRQAFLSHFAVENDDSEVAMRLVAAALNLAARRGLTAAVIGLPASDPWRLLVNARYRPIEYWTMLYAVYWPEACEPLELSSDVPAFPDIGLL